MRALVYDPQQKHGLRSADAPEPTPTPSQAIIEVHATSLNFGEVSYPIRELTSEQVERSFDKLRGFVNVVRSVTPRLREHGSITLLAGASAVKPPPGGFSVLAAASGSILSFGKALALELAPLRVNVLMSGVVDTAIHAKDREQTKAWAEKELPVKRFGQPEDIAQAIELLMTNPYLTAQTVTVDGGYTAM